MSEGLVIRGAKGEYKRVINGLFKKTSELSGGMHVYKKSQSEHFLEFIPGSDGIGKWMLKIREYMGQDNHNNIAFVHCDNGTELFDNSIRNFWQVKTFFGDYVVQPCVRSFQMNAEEIDREELLEATQKAARVANFIAENEACAAARAAATYDLCISGVTGCENSSTVNGLYKITSEIYNEMPVWQKGESQCVAFSISKSMWMSIAKSNMDSHYDYCNASVYCEIGTLPDKAPIGTWKVSLADDIFDKIQETILVTPVSSKASEEA